MVKKKEQKRKGKSAVHHRFCGLAEIAQNQKYIKVEGLF